MKLTERVANVLYDKEHGERTIEECIALARAALEETHKAFAEQGIILCWPNKDF